MTGPRFVPGGEWAPTPRERPTTPTQRCCAKCRRGVPGYGELPCGFNNRCPNPKCVHAANPAPTKNFDYLNHPKENQ